MITEVIKERYDVIIRLQRVTTVEREIQVLFQKVIIDEDWNTTNDNSKNSTTGNWHLLVAPQSVQDVKLLPPFREVDVWTLWCHHHVRIPQVDKGQVLKDQTPKTDKLVWKRQVFSGVYRVLTYRKGIHSGVYRVLTDG